jgi:hypothetical protein
MVRPMTKIVLLLLISSTAWAEDFLPEFDSARVDAFKSFIHESHRKRDQEWRNEQLELLGDRKSWEVPFSTDPLDPQTLAMLTEAYEHWQPPVCKRAEKSTPIQIVGEYHDEPHCMLVRGKNLCQLANHAIRFGNEGFIREDEYDAEQFIRAQSDLVGNLFTVATNNRFHGVPFHSLESGYVTSLSNISGSVDLFTRLLKQHPEFRAKKYDLKLLEPLMKKYDMQLLDNQLLKVVVALVIDSPVSNQLLAEFRKSGLNASKWLEQMREKYGTKVSHIEDMSFAEQEELSAKVAADVCSGLSFGDLAQLMQNTLGSYWTRRKKDIFTEIGFPTSMEEKFAAELERNIVALSFDEVDSLIATQLRTFNMAFNLVNAYCKEGPDVDKPLVVHVGLLHAYALKYLLREKFHADSVEVRNAVAEEFNQTEAEAQQELSDFVKLKK